MVGSKRHSILHTIEGGGPGGAETVLLELATNLDPSRFRSLALLTSDDWLKQQLLNRKVQTTLVDSKAWYDFRLPKALTKLVRREGVDLIHSHLPDQNFYSCVAARLTGSKVIVTYHGTPGLLNKAGVKTAIKRKMVRQSADAIVVVSDYLRRILVEEGFPDRKIVRIYNGVDVKQFGENLGEKIRAELGLEAKTKLVGMVANLRQSKGYEYFARAARQVANRIPEASFIAVGEIEETIRGQMCELLRDLDLEGRFRLLGFRSDIPQILNDLDVFVLSSTDEGLSIATLEAMAAAKPVVVTKSGGPEEIVEDGRTGRLVPPADPQALASGICELLQNPCVASAFARNARAEVESKFSLARMIAEYESLYDRCLGAD